MNPIEEIVPKIRTAAQTLKLHHSFGLTADLVKTMIEERKTAKEFTVHIEAIVQTNADGSEHVFTIEVMKYDAPETLTDKTKNKTKSPASEQIMIDAYNTGIDLLQELQDSFEDDFDVIRENCFGFVKIRNVCTGYTFRIRFNTISDLC